MTNKVIHIVRHGKALQDAYEIYDNERPLTVRGILNNIVVAGKVRAVYQKPELIISSFAARALHTAHIFASEMGYSHEKVIVNEKLYFCGDKEIFNIFRNLPQSANSVMIVGHNPDLTSVVNKLSVPIVNMSTSSTVTLTFDTDNWDDILTSKKTYTYITKE